MGGADSLPEWDRWAQRPYLVEIARQASFAIHAAAELAEAVQTSGVGWSAWYATQSFLTATANVSKLLRPAIKKGDWSPVARWGRQRGSRLMDALGVEPSSPLLDRQLRNSYEHMDERLDEWFLAESHWGAQYQHSGGPYAPPRSVPSPLRIIDPARGKVAFGPVEMEVPAIVRELSEVLQRAEQLDPLVKAEPGFGSVLALLSPIKPESRLDAPSQRPDEPVTAGLPATSLPSLEEALRQVVAVMRGPQSEAVEGEA